MNRLRWLLALAFVALSLAGCNVWMGTFLVPPQAWAGHVFEVYATASTTGSGGSITGILQLPLGFTVEGAAAFGQGSSTVFVPGGGRMAIPPTVVAPEPGHFVEGFTGSYPLGLGTGQSARLRVFVRAPSTPGSYVLKLALLGSNGVVPAGATSFATITAPPHVATITVLPDPVAPVTLEPLQLPSGAAPGFDSGVAIGDLDHDGLGDLVYTSSAPPAGLQVFLQRAGGTWQASPTPLGTSSHRYVGCAIGDFDGDGHRDLADNSGRILFGDGGSTWTPGPALPLTIPEWDGIAVGDVDGDGRDDVAFSAHTTDAVMVFRSGPGRTFANWSGSLPNGTNGPIGSNRLEIADVTGDGIVDLIAGGGLGLRVFEGNGLGQWQPRNAGLPGYQGAGSQVQFCVGDVDGDRRAEIVANVGALLSAFRYANGAWQAQSLPVAATPSLFATAMAAADVDRDGFGDVALVAGAVTFSASPHLLRSLGSSFDVPLSLVTTFPYQSVGGLVTGDLDGDTWPDLVATLAEEGVVAWYGTGSGTNPFGTGCGASGHPAPVTVGIGQPSIGNGAFAIGLQNATPSAPALLWLGWNHHVAHGLLLPYDLTAFGAPGCAVWTADDAVHFVLADPAGLATTPLPIPNDPALRRLLLFAQGATSAPGANALGWLFGQGLAVRVP